MRPDQDLIKKKELCILIRPVAHDHQLPHRKKWQKQINSKEIHHAEVWEIFDSDFTSFSLCVIIYTICRFFSFPCGESSIADQIIFRGARDVQNKSQMTARKSQFCIL